MGCYVHGNETSSFIRGRAFLDLLSNRDLLKEVFLPEELIPLKAFYTKSNEK
jgi:hypothetical protein